MSLQILKVIGGDLVTKLCLTLVTPWTVACQAPLPMGFPRQKYWSGWQFASLGDLLNPGIKSGSPALQVDCLPTEPPGKPTLVYMHIIKYKLKISKKEKHMREL